MKLLKLAMLGGLALALAACGSTTGVPGGVTAQIKYGEPDAGRHPYVGLLVFYNNAGVPQWRCTGALISPTVVLTAAHCAELQGPARIWFDEDVTSANVPQYPMGGGDSYTGRAYAYPGWRGGLFLPDTGDVGVVVLDRAVTNKGYAQLPAVGAVSDHYGPGKRATMTVVGYGLQSVKPDLMSARVRLVGEVQIVNLNSALTAGYNIHLSSNPGQGNGEGGTCFGDSGGPAFIGDSKVVGGVASFVLNSNCAGSGFHYRVDRKEVLDWVRSFIP